MVYFRGLMDITFAAATDVGRQRNHNEDNFLVDKKLQLFIVADGMGGHAAGEVASSITVHQLRDAVYENRDLLEKFSKGDDSVQGVEILQMLEHAAQAACGAVYDRAQEESDKRGMGTTVSVLLIVNGPQNPRGFIAHVGDSRIYLVRQKQTHQLTEDHSLMNELVKRGKIKPGEIENSPYKQFKNAVTRAIGVYPSVEVDTFDFDIFPGDQFLLCSDGMYVYFEDEELPSILGEGSIKEVPKSLVKRANDGGGHDNITTVVIRVAEESTESVDMRAADLSLKLEVLKGMPLFRYLSYKELVRVMNITETVEFEAGHTFLEEGGAGETMYVMLDGQVRLHKGERTITTLGKGQHFGEMALVDRSPRSLSATCTKPSRLISIRRKEFYEIIKKEPSLSVKLLWSFVQVLAERLRKTTTDLNIAREAADSASTSRTAAVEAEAARKVTEAFARVATAQIGDTAADSAESDDGEPEISISHDDDGDDEDDDEGAADGDDLDTAADETMPNLEPVPDAASERSEAK